MDILTWARAQWDRLLAMVCTFVGALVLVLGWLRVSGVAYPAEQLPYIVSAGLGGLFLLGVAATLWLSADLRDEWRKLDRIEQAIRDQGAVEEVPSEPTEMIPTATLHPEPSSVGGS